MAVWLVVQQCVFAQTRNVSLKSTNLHIFEAICVLFLVATLTYSMGWNSMLSIKSLADEAPFGKMYPKLPISEFKAKTGISLVG
jgi:hypothetical protein